ncbi:S-layer family protein [Polynucleobacter sp. MWH-S4W17]|uniref:beta strand repeat-containing protein n=1 Tax=Polynucleobacter sp. MWH-S4W17 TaxID=1855910 RepID=UPI001BFD1E05|nr:filamentous hemagglutinin N-terminal domain-containing protein [Polynucleobacter sp. MWH-S4W17]QWD80805.1 filamentous hemagglutinin N-terminal domain-containing protein [Polynucleobacter sp. MWH-S4W17]
MFGLDKYLWTKFSDQNDQKTNSTRFSQGQLSKQNFLTFFGHLAFSWCKNSISTKAKQISLAGLGSTFIAFLVGNLFIGSVAAANPTAPNLPNALPTNGQVVAGTASISQTQTPASAAMTVNQTSQRAVVNWDSFNVGKNASVTFNQPNANAVTLNRVTGATASMIEGAVKANGQVVFVNPNGVTFGKGAEINAAGVVATTMDISNKDFMEGKSTYKGNGKGSVTNEGKITTNVDGGYIALLAPEVRNDGYLLAKKGSGTVAMAAGEQITLDFKGNSLMSVKVDVGTYNALIENKRVVEVNGGLVVIAAGSANQLMASVIKNTGRISASSMVNNGGVIELVANTVTQAGKVTANSKIGEGGQINIVGNDITIAANSKTTATGATNGGQVNIGLAATAVSGGTQINAQASNPNQAAQNVKADADVASSKNQLAKTVTIEEGALIDTSATQTGNGGVIAIWSEVKTAVAGILKSMGGALSGNGGFIETSSKGQVSIAPTASINTSANNATGKAGTWLLDPVDLIIDISTANAISTALFNNNVTITVTSNTNTCPIGSCTQNGTGSLTIASGADILKAGTNLTTLTLSSAGIFNLNANISGQNLSVIISSSIAYLNVGSSITASEVTVQAQTIYSAGSIQTSNYLANTGNTLGNAIKLLAQAIYVSGRLSANIAPGAGTAGSIKLTANTITLSPGASLEANGDEGGRITVAANDSLWNSALIQVNGGNGRGGTLLITAANDIYFDQARLLANGAADGGVLTITTQAGDVNIANSTIQTNGSSGRGGSIGLSATNNTQIANSVIGANGYTQGGTIKIGNDATNGTLPFSILTRLDGNTIISAAQLDPNASNKAGGYIETSGHTLNLLSSINAGRGGIWLIDPYDIIIDSTNAGYISAALNAGTSVTITTSSASNVCGGNSCNQGGASGSYGDITVNSAIAKTNGSGEVTLTLTADRNIILNSSISNSSGLLHLALDSQGDGGISGNGTISVNGLVTFNVGGNGNGVFSGNIDSNAGVVKSGSGALTLTGNNSFTGGLLVSTGTLTIGGAGTLGDISGSGDYHGLLTIAPGASFVFDSSATQVIHVVAGSGDFIVQGSSSALTIYGNQDFSGNLTVNGVLNIEGGSNEPISGLGNSQSISINNNGIINLVGDDNSFVGYGSSTHLTINLGGLLYATGYSTYHLPDITLNGGVIDSGFPSSSPRPVDWRGVFNFDKTVVVTADSLVSAKTLALTEVGGTVFDVHSGATLSVTGIFFDVYGGPNSFIKRGNGTLSLTGINTQTGPTIIDRGTVIVADMSTFAGTTSTLYIGSTGILDLQGRVTMGALTIAAGGQIINTLGSRSGITVNGDVDIAGSVTTTRGQSYNSNNLSISGSVIAQDVTIRPLDLSRSMTVGGSLRLGNDLFLSTETLNHISATSLFLGSAQLTGALIVNAALEYQPDNGALRNITNLTLSSGSSIVLGDSISTRGDQNYAGPLYLNSGSGLQVELSSYLGNIFFQSSVDNLDDTSSSAGLRVSAAGAVFFGGCVGCQNSPISSLTVNANNAYIAGDVHTVNNQIYNTSITLGGLGSVTFGYIGPGSNRLQSDSGNIFFNGSIDNNDLTVAIDLTVSAPFINFNGCVGCNNGNLNSLKTFAMNAYIASDVYTNYDQIYNSFVTFGGLGPHNGSGSNYLFSNAGSITFSYAVNNDDSSYPVDLTLAANAIYFYDCVGCSNGYLNSLTTGAYVTYIAGDVFTYHDQYYDSNVVLGGRGNSSPGYNGPGRNWLQSVGGNITFNGDLDIGNDPVDLTLTSNTSINFNGCVGCNNGALNSLTTYASNTYISSDVFTIGDQTYNSRVSLGGYGASGVGTNLLQASNGSIYFANTVDNDFFAQGPVDLTVSANNVGFNECVGCSYGSSQMIALNSLTVNVPMGGNIYIGNSVLTWGDQNYFGSVTLGSIAPSGVMPFLPLQGSYNSVFASVGGNISFHGVIDADISNGSSSIDLAVIAGNVNFYDCVGCNHPLNSLAVMVSYPGNQLFNWSGSYVGNIYLAGDVHTISDQNYYGPVTLGAQGQTAPYSNVLTSTNGAISFYSTVDNAADTVDLTLIANNFFFNDCVGCINGSLNNITITPNASIQSLELGGSLPTGDVVFSQSTLNLIHAYTFSINGSLASPSITLNAMDYQADGDALQFIQNLTIYAGNGNINIAGAVTALSVQTYVSNTFSTDYVLTAQIIAIQPSDLARHMTLGGSSVPSNELFLSDATLNKLHAYTLVVGNENYTGLLTLNTMDHQGDASAFQRISDLVVLAGSGDISVAGPISISGALTIVADNFSTAYSLSADSAIYIKANDLSRPITVGGDSRLVGDLFISNSTLRYLRTNYLSIGNDESTAALTVNDVLDYRNISDNLYNINMLALLSGSGIFLTRDITTRWNQEYYGPVFLRPASGVNSITLSIPNGGAISFYGTIDNADTNLAVDLTLAAGDINNWGAQVSFYGCVGCNNGPLGSLTTYAANTYISGDVFTYGSQTYNSNVTLGGWGYNTPYYNTPGSNWLQSIYGDITFRGTVDNDYRSYGPVDLTVSAIYIGFEDCVGCYSYAPLNSLTINALGTYISGDIFTNGDQIFNSNVSLGGWGYNNPNYYGPGSNWLQSSSGSIAFYGALDSDYFPVDLTVSAYNNVKFGDCVGCANYYGSFGLNSLTVNISNSGNIYISNVVLTWGDQNYNGPVILTSNGIWGPLPFSQFSDLYSHVLSSGYGSINFNGAVDADINNLYPVDLAIAAPYINFYGCVGCNQPLNTLTAIVPYSNTSYYDYFSYLDIGMPGNIYIAGDVHTYGNQNYNGPVTLGAYGGPPNSLTNNLTSTAGNITFYSTVDNDFRALDNSELIITANNVNFIDCVGCNNGSLHRVTTYANNTYIAGDVYTEDDQTYNSNVTLGGWGYNTPGYMGPGSNWLQSFRGSITFNGNVDSDYFPAALTVAADYSVNFNGCVGCNGYFPIYSLVTFAPFTYLGADVHTIYDQAYNSNVVLGPNANFLQSVYGSIAFGSQVDNSDSSTPASLYILANNVTFADCVGCNNGSLNTISIQPSDLTLSVTLGNDSGSPGGMYFDTATLNKLHTNTLIIDSSQGSGSLTLNSMDYRNNGDALQYISNLSFYSGEGGLNIAGPIAISQTQSYSTNSFVSNYDLLASSAIYIQAIDTNIPVTLGGDNGKGGDLFISNATLKNLHTNSLVIGRSDSAATLTVNDTLDYVSGNNLQYINNLYLYSGYNGIVLTHDITTRGDQNYGAAVYLAPATGSAINLSTASGGNIVFSGAIDNIDPATPIDLTATAALVSMYGCVGCGADLNSLTVNGNSLVSESVLTKYDQNYYGYLNISPYYNGTNIALFKSTSGSIDFHGSIGGYDGWGFGTLTAIVGNAGEVRFSGETAGWEGYGYNGQPVGSINIQSNTFSAPYALTAYSSISIKPSDSSRSISVGGPEVIGNLYLSNTTLNHLHADTLLIGDTNSTGILTVNSALDYRQSNSNLQYINNLALMSGMSAGIILADNITTHGNQDYIGPVYLAPNNGTFIALSTLRNGNITFGSTVNNFDPSSPISLSALASFINYSDCIGCNNSPLRSLNSNAFASYIAGDIRTVGNQDYSSTVSFSGPNSWMPGPGAYNLQSDSGNITFRGNVQNTNADQPVDLLVSAASIRFNGCVGCSNSPLNSLTINANNTYISSDVHTYGNQIYNGSISLGANGNSYGSNNNFLESVSGLISFSSNIDNALWQANLALVANSIIFNGCVGCISPLGTISIQSSDISIPITLGGLTGSFGDLFFGRAMLNRLHADTLAIGSINSTGLLTLNGLDYRNGGDALENISNLYVYAGSGGLNIAGPVSISGTQSYTSNVFTTSYDLGADTIVIQTSDLTRPITLGGALHLGDDLLIDNNTLSHLRANTLIVGNWGNWGRTAPIVVNEVLDYRPGNNLQYVRNLWLNAGDPGIFVRYDITTAGDQSYGGPLYLSPASGNSISLSSLEGGNVEFWGSVDNASPAQPVNLTVTANNVNFFNCVGCNPASGPLGGLTSNANNTYISADVYTIGDQNYHGAVTLGAYGGAIDSLTNTLSSTNGNISLYGAVDNDIEGAGASELIISANNVNFYGCVGCNNGPLFSLDANTLVTYISGDIYTFLDQTYHGSVLLGGNGNNGLASNTLHSDVGNINFYGAVDNSDPSLPVNLTVTAQYIIFEDCVGCNNGPLGSLTTVANNAYISGDVLTVGDQTYFSSVTLGGLGYNTPGYSGLGSNWLQSSNGNITFMGTVDNDRDNAYDRVDLTVLARNVSFNGCVGCSYGNYLNAGLNSLRVEVPDDGSIYIDSTVLTWNDQNYYGAVRLGGNGAYSDFYIGPITTSVGNLFESAYGNINFYGTVDNANINNPVDMAAIAQNVSFYGCVGCNPVTGPLNSLTVMVPYVGNDYSYYGWNYQYPGNIYIASDVNTIHDQNYIGPVTLGGGGWNAPGSNTFFSAQGNINFGGTVDNDNPFAPVDLTVNAFLVNFFDCVGCNVNYLQSLTVTADSTYIASDVYTINDQYYNTSVTLGGYGNNAGPNSNTLYSDMGAITFANSVDSDSYWGSGPSNLNVVASYINFSGLVGFGQALNSLTTGGYDSHVYISGDVYTIGGQDFFSAVTLGGQGLNSPGTNYLSASSGGISFYGSVSNAAAPVDLTISASAINFYDCVGCNNGPLNSLTVNAAYTTYIGGDIHTVNDQTYNSAVILGGWGSIEGGNLLTSDLGTITFNYVVDTPNRPTDLYLAANTIIFNDCVGCNNGSFNAVYIQPSDLSRSIIVSGNDIDPGSDLYIGDAMLGQIHAYTLYIGNPLSTAPLIVNGALDYQSNLQNVIGLTLASGSSGGIYLTDNISTSGDQNYYGPVYLSPTTGSSITLFANSSESRVNFWDVVYSYPSQNDLIVTAGSSVNFYNCVDCGIFKLNNLTVNAPYIYLASDVFTSGDQSYNGAINLGGNGYSAFGSNILHSSGGTITFGGTVDVDAERGYGQVDLKLIANNLSFNGCIGCNNVPMNSVTIYPSDPTLSISVAGLDNKAGWDLYLSDAMLNAIHTNNLIIGNPDNIAPLIVNGPLDGAGSNLYNVYNLTLAAGSGGIILRNDITTNGSQEYFGQVYLAPSSGSINLISLYRASITFGGSVDNVDSGLPVNLAVAANNIYFRDCVGCNNGPLGSLNVNALNTYISADISTAQAQTYNGSVTLDGDAILSGGDILFSGDIFSNGAYGLSVNAINASFTNVSDLTHLNLQIANTATISGAYSGNGDLTLGGAGILTLPGVNTYTGNTNITLGVTLALVGSGSIASSSAVNVDGVFDISQATAPVSIKALNDFTSWAGYGLVSLGSNTLTIGSASGVGSFSGVIQDDGQTGGNLVITGDGYTQTLSGINTYIGTTNITQGATLALVGAGSIANSVSVNVDGVLDISGLGSYSILDLFNSTLPWTGDGTVYATDSTVNLMLDGGGLCLNGCPAPAPFSLTPASGRSMMVITPSGSTTDIFGIDDALHLTPGSMLSQVSGGTTNYGFITKQVYLRAGKYSFAWAYAANDYLPYLDGVFFSISGSGTNSAVLLSRNGGPSSANTDGYPAGVVILPSFGSTTWINQSIVVPTNGNYQIGFGSFNHSDTNVDPYFFVSSNSGTYSGAPLVGGSLTTNIKNFTGSGVVTLGANTLAISNTSSKVFSGNIIDGLNGVGGGIAINQGVQTLSGQNSYTGNTVINNGGLLLVGSGSLGNTSSLLTISNGSLNVDNGNLTIGSLFMSGSSSFINVSNGDLNVGNGATIAGSINASNNQTYSGSVVLGSDAILSGNSFIFRSTIDGNYDLSINAAGQVKFYDTVGGNRALNNLYVQAGDRIVLYSDVITSYDQEYGGPVQIGPWSGGTVTLTSNNGSIYFDSTVDSHGPDNQGGGNLSCVTAYADGGVYFYGDVGLTKPLASLEVFATTYIGSSISTSGYQKYEGDVYLLGDVSLNTNNSLIKFASSVNSYGSYTIPSVTFYLTTDGTGISYTWTGIKQAGQYINGYYCDFCEIPLGVNGDNFNDRVQSILVGPNSSFTLFQHGGLGGWSLSFANSASQSILFVPQYTDGSSFLLSAIAGHNGGGASLVINAGSGKVSLLGAVGNIHSLYDLTVNAGRVDIRNDVTTTNDQTYNAPVQIGPWNGGTVTLTSNNGSIYFDSTVDSHGPDGQWNGNLSNLNVYADYGQVKFYDTVGGNRALNNLYVQAGDRIVLYSDVITSYDQEYGGPVQIGPWNGGTVNTVSTNGNISFHSTLDSHGPNGDWSGNLSSLGIGADNGVVRFYGEVGNNQQLYYLYIHAGRIVLYNNVDTLSDQTYLGPVQIGPWSGGSVVLTSGSGNIFFGSTVNSHGANNQWGGNLSDLTVAANNFSFAGEIGGIYPLSSLYVSTSESIGVSASAHTTGDQNYVTNYFLMGDSASLNSSQGNIVISAARFNNLNNAGNSINTPMGYWQIWSSNASPFDADVGDQLGGLVYDYKQYGANYNSQMGAHAGNGYLLSYVPQLTISLVGDISKEYDGNSGISLSSGNYLISGMSPGDSAQVSSILTSYIGGVNPSYAGIDKLVIVEGISVDALSINAKPVYGYTLAASTVMANIGIISPKSIVITNTASSTTYDGATSYAGTMTAAGYGHTALVGADAIGSVTQTASIGGSTVTGVAQAGTFTSTPSGAVLSSGIADNYSFSYIGATNTVAKADLTIAAVASLTGNTYRGTAYTGTYTTTALGSDASGITVTGQATGINAGTYTSNLSASGAVLSNYNLQAPINADLVISPKSIVISNTASATTYDGVTSYAGTMTAAGYGHTDLVGSDAIGSVTQTASIGGSTVTGVAQAGSFTSTPSGATLSSGIADNYSFSYVGATNTVAKANLTIAAVASLTGNTYRGSAYTGTYTTTALGSDASGITVTGQATGINAGTYTSNLSASGAVLSNYNTPTITNADLVISPKSIVISNTASATTYDGVTSYAGTMTAAGYGHTALVGSDAIGSVTQTASIGGSTVTGVAQAGTFTSTPSGAVLSSGIADNYSFSYIGATNTVAKADLTIAAVASLTGNTYRGTAYTGTYTTTALGSDASGITVTGQATGINAGTYTSNLSASGAVLSNYNLQAPINADLVISPAPLGIEVTGTYSGTRNITPSSFAVTGLMSGDTVRSIVSANLADANVAYGNNYITSISGVSGTAVMSNYYITTTYNPTPNTSTTNAATITPANLVITATNDAKFVTQTDLVGSANNCGLNTACAGGYMGVTYNGFVNGENKDVLIGSPTVIRTNAGTEEARVYAGVLKASGLSATNYSISYINGDYVIAPAKTLLVRVTPASQVYGSNPTFTVKAQYLDADNRTIIDLTPSINGSAVSIVDGASGGANFTLSLAGATTSTSGNINVGGYNLAATNSTVTGNNFNSLTVVGSNTIIPYTLRPNQLGISGVSKVYDGNINIGGLVLNVDPTLSTVLGSGVSKDKVTIIGSGTFDNRNVGVSKAVDINLTLSGDDGGNYVLATNAYSANIGTITQLNSVSYVGGVGGNWSTQSNWAGGAIPTLNNVANVYIPVGSSVVYDVAAVNAGGAMISNIINNGTLTINESTNTMISNSLGGSGIYAQIGSGILTIAGNNNQVNPGPLTGQISVANGKTLILANADALGNGSILSDNGRVGLDASITLRSFTVNGPVTLISDIKTVDSQQYGGAVTLSSGTANVPMVISSQDGNIAFLSTVNSDSENRSLTINALSGKVTLTDTVGYLSPSRLAKGPSIYDLAINAKDILLKGDVYTLNTQTYNGAVVISDNGSNGLTRTFLSEDPSITFLGTIDDSLNITHTLSVKAVSFDANQVPLITFRGAIGSIVPLGGLVVVTEMHLDPDPAKPGTPAGDITIGAGISTIGPQTYSGNGIILDPAPGAGPIYLTTKDGAILLYGVNGLRDDLAAYVRAGDGSTPVAVQNTVPKVAVAQPSSRVLGSYIPPLDPEDEWFNPARYGLDSNVSVGEPSTIVPCEVELTEECVKG